MADAADCCGCCLLCCACFSACGRLCLWLPWGRDKRKIKEFEEDEDYVANVERQAQAERHTQPLPHQMRAFGEGNGSYPPRNTQNYNQANGYHPNEYGPPGRQPESKPEAHMSPHYPEIQRPAPYRTSEGTTPNSSHNQTNRYLPNAYPPQ